MKTYILERGWNADKRVTVEDDVDICSSSYDDCGDKHYTVKFVRRANRGQSEQIAAFSNVASFYLEGTDIQTLKSEEEDVMATSVKANKMVWQSN